MTIKTSFWQEYLKRTDKTASSNTPQQYEKIMMQGKKQLEGAIEDFRLKLSKIPLGQLSEKAQTSLRSYEEFLAKQISVQDKK